MALLILGNQLFPRTHLPRGDDKRVFIAEDYELCTYYRQHKQKLILFLSAMRSYAEELEDAGFEVTYCKLTEETKEQSYEDKLERFFQENDISELTAFEIEDKFMEQRITDCCKKNDVALEIRQSPMFLVSRGEFESYLAEHKQPFMKTFYEQLRRERDILMDGAGKPLGGKFSFDEENREKLPAHLQPPPLPTLEHDAHVDEVAKLIEELFADHPGAGGSLWLPVRRTQALSWLKEFFEHRFAEFGPYEDALTTRSDIVFHSVLSPLLNLGLLTPKEVLDRAIDFASEQEVPFSSLEGFVRQILGWREFVRGIYRNFSEQQEQQNFWGHEAGLAACWYEGTTGIPPVDDAIQKALRYGYNHHIERLMVLSNVMLLSRIHPDAVHRWFMEMYVDSADWVMGPNVYGMGQFSDGGIFATKPYTCGSNYIRKMSDYQKGPWCDILDGLYWQFIEDNKDFYASNARMGMVLGTLGRMDSSRKKRIYKAAETFRERTTSG